METKDGFLVINKDKGCTSHDCVKQIRKLLDTKKVGHTGTLDPGVSGTLPIAIGSATRFIQYLPQAKTYIGEIKLGIRTSTDDIYGKIINQKNFSIINLEKLNDFKDNDTVNLDSLVKKGLIFKPKFPLKILGNGKINVKLKVQAHAFTKVAKQKIEDAGGSCELINNK